MAKRPTKAERREAERVRIAAMSNRELLEGTIDLAGGDDYDGGCTDAGHVSFGLHRAELEARLADWLAR